MLLNHLSDIPAAIQQAKSDADAESGWVYATRDTRDLLLMHLPAHCLTEKFFDFLLRDGAWIWRRPFLYQNPAFEGEVLQAAVRATDRLLKRSWDGRYVPIPLEDLMTFLRELASRGAVPPEQVQEYAEWALAPVKSPDAPWSRIAIGGLLLRFPGLSDEMDRRLLTHVESNVRELFGDPDSQMEENSDDPLFRLVHHPEVSVETLKAIAAEGQLGLAHDEILREPRAYTNLEVVERLLPHGDTHRVLTVIGRGPASLYKEALWILVERDPKKAVQALKSRPAGMSFTQEEIIPLLSSENSELRLQGMLLATQLKERGKQSVKTTPPSPVESVQRHPGS